MLALLRSACTSASRLSRGEMVAALSVPFLAGTDPDRMEDIRLATIATAKAMTSAIPGPVAR